jgi:uncharacterized membrane protein
MSSNRVCSVDRIEYVIRLEANGSASWTIRQTGTDIKVSPDTLTQFQNNITSLIIAAMSKTHRDMMATAPSIRSTVSGSYVEVEYNFTWENFSRIENASMIAGDVLQVDNFFARLYGDGEVAITYPSKYTVEKVSPLPILRDDAHQSLRWAGTKDFVNGLPVISLKERTSSLLDMLGQNAAIVAGLATIVAVFSASCYTINRRRKRTRSSLSPGVPILPEIETDEERVVKLLRSSGGSLFQSAITEKCNFSKAKTSQLLTALEKKGIVGRHKRGRDKIVILSQENRK